MGRWQRLAPSWLQVFLQAVTHEVRENLYFQAIAWRGVLELSFDLFYIAFELLRNYRRRKFGPPNEETPVGRLPPEVLITILVHLRPRLLEIPPISSTSGVKFGLDRRAMNYRSIIAARSVCRAWVGSATEVLFHTVHLRSVDKLVRFTNAVLRRPDLGQHVFSISFERYIVSRDFILSSPPERFQQLAEVIGRASNIRLPFIDSSISPQDGNEDAVWQDDRVFGLVHCTTRATRLELAGTWVDFPAEEVDLRHAYISMSSTAAAYGLRFQNLQILKLENLRLRNPPTVAPWPKLRELKLHSCQVSPNWIRTIGDGDVPLYSLELNMMDTLDLSEREERSLSRFLGPLLCAKLEIIFTSDSAIGRVDAFTSLKSLTMRSLGLSWVWFQGGYSQLEQLSLSLWNRPRDTLSEYNSYTWITPVYRRIITEVGQIYRHLPVWKKHAPNLRRIDIWDEVGFTTMRTWSVLAVLLKEVALAKYDFQIEIHLTPSREMLSHYETRFSSPRSRRRWRDIKESWDEFRGMWGSEAE